MVWKESAKISRLSCGPVCIHFSVALGAYGYLAELRREALILKPEYRTAFLVGKWCKIEATI